jgi:hypothetical protein
MGVPLLANSQLGTFYPPNWIVAPLSPPDGVRISILLHVAWAGVGTYALARRALGVGRLAALTSALIFAFSGYVGAHVEQINQLQGLAWLPWLLYLFDRALKRPPPNALLLAMALALQFFTGHTQTVFISGVALALYALCNRPVRGILTLAGAGVITLVLALPQLLPTLELASVSNRRGGLNINQATAFSFSPFVTGRGLLPSYDALIFGEYVGYPGVIGLGLAIVGALAGWTRRRIRLPLSPRATWLIMALVGLALAYGLYNPLYWLIGTLPGFNLFRVPARWLALFALGTAMLAGLGIESIRGAVVRSAEGRHAGLPLQPRSWRSWRLGGSKSFVIVLVLVLLAASSALTGRQNDGTPFSLPTPLTLIGWLTALLVLLVGLWRRWRLLLAGGALLELWLASQILPYNALVPPDAYSAQRFTESYLLAAKADQTPPGRVLSISGLLFDPGDRAALEARYDALGMSAEVRALAFDTVKLREVAAANLPLIWGIPSVDGFDGGLLPTAYYTAFTSLLLPEGELRTIDGRLREILAKPECDGACIPHRRWMDLMNVRYLITDKVYDLVHDGVFYDPQLSGVVFGNPQSFVGDIVDLLCTLCTIEHVTLMRGGEALLEGEPVPVGAYTRQRYRLPSSYDGSDIVILADDPVQAVTLVDTRTGDFQQLTPALWQRVLSSDIKLYENRPLVPRAFITGESIYVADTDRGTEDALDLMRVPTFNPAQTAIIARDNPGSAEFQTFLPAPLAAEITEYADTRITLKANAADPGYLVLSDAYYPGWVATVNGVETPVERADVMFRAVRVPQGESTVVMEYRPYWLTLAPLAGGAAWLITLITILVLRRSKAYKQKIWDNEQ